MNFTIDRFEGEFAVVELENEEFVNIPKKLLPGDAKEGDVFTLTKNEDETASRQKRIDDLMDNLFE